MCKRTGFLIYSLFFVVLLVMTGGSVLAAQTANGSVSGIENLLRGTQYEHLLSESRNTPELTIADKGFLPNFGNYFDNSTPGWGFDIQRLGNFIFAVWFTYNLDGTPTWYIIVGELTAKGNGMSITGDINSFKWDGTEATATNVGTMTIVWTDESIADVTWTLDGDDGAASIAFAVFASGPAYADMTGHYFDFNASGWGFTLLTQGNVTVLTMYWYSGGQPVWAQGVSGVLGFDQLFDLLFFNGPGLCPACLPRKGVGGGGGFTTEPLETVQVNWAPWIDWPADSQRGSPVVNIQRLNPVFKGGPLGPNPFEDIPLGFAPVTVQGVTSVYGDGFDPDYEWFIGPGKGGGCLEFQYDPGVLGFPPTPTGLQTGYLLLEPDAHTTLLPTFTNAECSNPITINVFGGDPFPAGIRMAPTGDDGLAMTWEALIEADAAKYSSAKGGDGRRQSAARKPRTVSQKGADAIYGYGGTAAGLIAGDDFISYFPFAPFLPPPSSDSITNNPENGATIIIPFP